VVEDGLEAVRELAAEQLSTQPQAPLRLRLIRESGECLSERAGFDLAMLCHDT